MDHGDGEGDVMAKGRKTGGRIAVPMLEKLMQKSMPEPNSGCWLWLGNVNRQGYGLVVQPMGKGSIRYRLAHRVAYQCFKGPFDQSLDVCHSCDVPGCINPDHLWLGTHTDNMRDKARKGRGNHARGSAQGQAKINEEIALEIKRASGTAKQIAARLNVSPNIVAQVRSGKTWRHVTDAQASA